MRQIRREACQNVQSLNKQSLLAMIANTFIPKYKLVNQTGGEVTFQEESHFLASLDENDWSIQSFNPLTREVCVLVTTPSGSRIISITIPNVSIH